MSEPTQAVAPATTATTIHPSDVVWTRAQGEGLPILGVALFVYGFVELVAKPYWRSHWQSGHINEDEKSRRVLLSTLPPAFLWACAVDASGLLAFFGLELPPNVLGFVLSVASSTMAFAGCAVLIAVFVRSVRPLDLLRENIYARFGVDRAASARGHKDATGILNLAEIHKAVDAKNKEV